MSPAELDELRQQVRNLADRVARLEAGLAKTPDTASTLTESKCPIVPASLVQPPYASLAVEPEGLPRTAEARDASPTPVPVSPPLLPVLGAATLGLAGAYLLRAVAESGVLPPRLIFGAGTLYAVAWLLAAARPRAERRIVTILYSLTAAMILSPLVWEATARFHMISPGQAGLILVAFTLIGLAVSWRQNLVAVATLSILASIGTAGALLISTYDALPCTFVFLAIAAAVETCACLDRWLGERWLAAATADLSVLLATWLVTNPRGLPESYAPIPAAGLFAAQMALLVIYLASVISRTLLRGRTFTNFETVQCALAFLIGLGGAIRLASEGSHLTPAVAGFALLCGAACYAVAFKVLARQGLHGRNFYTYSTFGILLVLIGCRMLLDDQAAALAWSLLALACIGAGGFWGRFTLEVHGGIYLLLALLLSGALHQAATNLLGTGFGLESIPPALWAGAAVAGVGYLLAVWSARSVDGGWNFHAFRVGMAAVVVWLVLGLCAGSLTGLYHGVFSLAAGDSYCATLRTGAIVGVTLLLAYASSRFGFRDLAQLVYPLMILGGYRLLADDLHQDRKTALFLSLLLYGAALMALPRLRRPRATSLP